MAKADAGAPRLSVAHKIVRAITSSCVILCKIEKDSLFYTFWLKKHPHQLGQNCAFMHNCYSSRAYMHGYCSICISYFSIFSVSPSLLLSMPSNSHGLTSLFHFLNRSERRKTLSAVSFSHLIPLASTIADRHQSLTATTTDFHHHRSLISPPISDLSTNLIAFLYFWLFDQWVSG